MKSKLIYSFPFYNNLQILEYELRYGVDKLKPIQPKSRQAEEMDVILESFRKLREGLFATESKDVFAVEGKKK